MILRPHRRPFEKINIEMKHLPYKSNAQIQLNGRELRTENFKKKQKEIRFRDKYVEIRESMFIIYLLRSKN